MMKRIKALYYTKGRFGKRAIEIVDADSENLYSMGQHPTKIKKEDLSKDCFL